MLDSVIKAQLKVYFERIVYPLELAASLDESDDSADLWRLLQQLAELSNKIAVRRTDDDMRRPSFAIRRLGSEIAVRFAGLPLGHEFNSLALALLHVGGLPPKETPEQIAEVKALDGDHRFEIYFSQSCYNCPDVVQAINLMAALNPKVQAVSIDGALFQQEVATREVLAVPSVFLNGKLFSVGRIDLSKILAKLNNRTEASAAAALKPRAPFDVLVVGGGPAGVAAAIYAARKGLHTGLVAERFGGQVRDSLTIENFISVPHMEGPELVAGLEAHVNAYSVDVMMEQKAVELIPARMPGGISELRLASGASLKGRAVILAPGAHYRRLNVPGEREYTNSGVSYCTHCDGPLFKAKRVAVIGGGNSGVEAAIDLAGIATHVTLIEYEIGLSADEVLQARLRELANVNVLTSAQTAKIEGDDGRVTGISYWERQCRAIRRLELDGVFVQIGLTPSTGWLKNAVALTSYGEIQIDAHGKTSAAGVFAAGDATTVPYKQIVIAAGEGAKASISAFDYLVRTPRSAAAA